MSQSTHGVVGKAVGASYLVKRLPGIKLDPTPRWPDLTGIAFVAGIGFTASLLVGRLSFPADSPPAHVEVGVLVGSPLSAAIGAAILARRNQTYGSHTKTAP